MSCASCGHYEATPGGHCQHQVGAGMCSKAVGPICVQLTDQRTSLTKAPVLSTGATELSALATKIAESNRVAIDVRSVEIDGIGLGGRVCSFGFDDGTLCAIDLLEDNCEGLFLAMTRPKLIGIALKECLIALAERLPSEPLDLLDLGIVSRVLEAGNERAQHDSRRSPQGTIRNRLRVYRE